jgi:PAS domain S-box-containing protein
MNQRIRARRLLELGRLRHEVCALEASLGLSGSAGRLPTSDGNDGVDLGAAAYQLVAEFATDFISIHAANGDYLFASPACSRLFGWQSEELLGTNAYDYFHPEDLERIAATHGEQAGGDEQAVEYRLRRADGGYCWVETRSRAHVREGSVQQIVCVTRDIEERKTFERALERSNAELRQFARVVAHDLREPARTACSFADLLHRRARHRLDECTARYLDFVGQSCRRMLGVVDDLLDYATLEGHGPAAETVAVDALVEDAWGAVSAAVEGSGARIRRDTLPVIRANRTTLTVALQNLFANAIKFARPGVPPVVEVSARREPAASTLVVRDNGRGFAAADAEKMFDVFVRLLPASEAEGTGIGLAMVKKVALLHGGRVWAEGRPGEGAAFYIELPDEPTEPTDSLPA